MSDAISEVQNDILMVLLNGLCWSDIDREDRIDDLVRELALNFTAWKEEFRVWDLERLKVNLTA